MGLGDILFGSKPKAKVTTKPTMTPEQRSLLDKYTKTLFEKDPGTILGFEQYGGNEQADSLAGLSLSAIENMVMEMASPTSNAALAEQQLGSFLKGEKTGESPFNEYFRTAVQDPAVEAFTRDIMPAISRSFGGSGFFSTDRKMADEAAIRDLNNSLVRTRAEGAYKERQTDIDTMLRAIGLSPELTAGIEGNLINALQAAIAGGDQTLNQFLKLQGLRGLEFDELMAILSQRPFENIATVTGGSSGLLSGMGQGIGTGIGAVIAGCAIAISAFGPENPEWIRFYFWKELLAPTWFRKWYNKNAVLVARWINRYPVVKPAIRFVLRRLSK